MKRAIAGLAATLVVSGGLWTAGLIVAPGLAQAGGPYTWCPGEDPGGYGGAFNTPGPPVWDWNVCHTYYVVQAGQGNVSPSIWEGDNPPAPRTPFCYPWCL